MKPVSKKGPKIVGHGNGPHIYAGEAIEVSFDGATVTLIFGNLEARIPNKDGNPTDLPVISICGKLTLSPSAAAASIAMITNVLNAVAGQHQQKPPVGTSVN